MYSLREYRAVRPDRVSEPLVMTVLSLKEHSLVLAFMNAKCLRETYILS